MLWPCITPSASSDSLGLRLLVPLSEELLFSICITVPKLGFLQTFAIQKALIVTIALGKHHSYDYISSLYLQRLLSKTHRYLAGFICWSPKAFFPLYFAVYVVQGIGKYYISMLETGKAWLPKKESETWTATLCLIFKRLDYRSSYLLAWLLRCQRYNLLLCH